MKTIRIIMTAMLSASLAAATVPAAAADVIVDAAAQNAPTRVASESRSETPKERLICKRFSHSESRMKSFRACHTADEWKKIERGTL